MVKVQSNQIEKVIKEGNINKFELVNIILCICIGLIGEIYYMKTGLFDIIMSESIFIGMILPLLILVFPVMLYIIIIIIKASSNQIEKVVKKGEEL